MTFPVGGCDRWLSVARAVAAGEGVPVVLHPNCVDKFGVSKEAWLRDRGLAGFMTSDKRSMAFRRNPSGAHWRRRDFLNPLG